MSSEIPSAYVVRALARRPAEHCDRCGQRMFVKRSSGLCPFCLAGRPVRPLECSRLPAAPGEPFAPRLGASGSWHRLALRRRMRDLVSRSRRPVKGEAVPNPT